MTRAPRTAMPSEPTEPKVAAPAVDEAVALAPVALPEPEDSAVVVAVSLAVDDAPVPVMVGLTVVSESVVGRRETEAEVEEPEGAAVLPALASEQLTPALMAEQKALAAGRTSFRAVCSPHAASTQVVALVVMSCWCASAHWQA